MDNDELKRIIFQSHGQDLRALKFMQAQIATLTAKLERVREIMKDSLRLSDDAPTWDLSAARLRSGIKEILREVGQ